MEDKRNKYFISFWAEDNDNIPMSGIYPFDYNVLENDDSLKKTEEILGDIWFGDNRKIVILNIFKC